MKGAPQPNNFVNAQPIAHIHREWFGHNAWSTTCFGHDFVELESQLMNSMCLLVHNCSTDSATCAVKGDCNSLCLSVISR